MKKRLISILTLTAIGLMSMFSMACMGHPVEVPPGHIGKINTQGGLQEEVIYPKQLKLNQWCVSCDSLILAETTDFPVQDELVIYMPKDELNLTVEVQGTFTIDSSGNNVDQIFSRLSPVPTEDSRVFLISADRTYDTYAPRVIREAVRSAMTKYSIDHVMNNREQISQEMTQVVYDRLADTPVKPLQFGLANIQPPEVIVTAQIEARQREIEKQKAEAQKEIDITEAEAALEVAKKQQAVDLVEAETQVLVEKKLNEAVSPAYITQRYLKFLQQMAENENVVFFPYDSIETPGLGYRIFQENK